MQRSYGGSKLSTFVRTTALITVLAAAAGVVLELRSAGPVYAATYTVNSANDVSDGACDAAHCSLREAIAAANASAGKDLVTFDIAGATTIAAGSPLPVVSDPLTIDGTTQPGYAGAPVIEVNGASAGAGADGIVLAAGSSEVRGLAVTGFAGNGVRLVGSGDNRVQAMYIGLAPDGTTLRGNGGHGVAIDSSAITTVGGTSASERNVIGGSGGYGVSIAGAGAAVNRVRGNYIGTDATGMVAAPNALGGVRVAGDNNTVGGFTQDVRNVISGNTGPGVSVFGDFTSQNLIQGNYIGVAADGQTALGNGSHGVLLDNAVGHNSIGGTVAGAGNVIAHNARNGVFVASGIGHPVLGNSIFDNTGLGIDLIDAAGSWGIVTLNDPDDTDGGANNRQNYPVVASALPVAGGLTITGTLDSTGSESFRVEFFASPACDGTHGEGERFLGSTNVTTDAAGVASFSLTLDVVVPEGWQITSTARDSSSNTSEFSACAPAGEPVSPTPTATSTATDTPTQTPTTTSTDTPTPTTTATSVPTHTPTATNTPVPPTSTPTFPAGATATATIAAPRGLCGIADLDGDGRVTGRDLSKLVHSMKQKPPDPAYDLNGDGKVDGRDLQELKRCVEAEQQHADR